MAVELNDAVAGGASSQCGELKFTTAHCTAAHYTRRSIRCKRKWA